MVSPAFNWSGWYLGATAGADWGRSKVNLTSPNSAAFGLAAADIATFTTAGTQSLRGSSVTGGFETGYNFQVSPNFVLGIEGDEQYIGFRKSLATAFIQPVSLLPGSVAETVKADWLTTLRGRVGLVLDRSLLYGTGGLAVANLQLGQQANFNNGASFNNGTASSLKAGWVAGGGWEYAFAAPNWSAKIEYLYANLGRVSTTSFNTAIPAASFVSSANLKENIVRVGLNYRFGH